MKINIIAAMDSAGGIGKDNDIPWKLSGDLKRFKRITMGHPIIMGRKTFESIGRPLPGRDNIILTRQKDFKVDGTYVYNSIAEMECLFPMYSKRSEIFVIGGEEVYKDFLPIANKLYLTLVHGHYNCDVSFPEFNEDDFLEIEREQGKGEPIHRYTILQRKI